MLINLRNAMMGGRPKNLMHWQNNANFAPNGNMPYNTQSCAGLDYIPVVGGHSLSWKFGWPAAPSGFSPCLVVYNSEKARIDYWVSRDRTLNIHANAAFVRISVKPGFKADAYIYDNTAGAYLFKDERILSA